MNIKKTVIGFTTILGVVIGGAVVRQEVGVSMVRECQNSIQAYTEIAEVQLEGMNQTKAYLDLVVNNPFSALSVGGELIEVSHDVQDRWSDYEEALGEKRQDCFSGSPKAVFTGAQTWLNRIDTKGNIEDEVSSLREEIVNQVSLLKN